MKILLKILFLALPSVLWGQDTIPYVQAGQIANWRTAAMENDTVYVVNFWATWCEPCVAELPAFEKLNSAYANRPVKVILLSMDLRRQVQSKLLPFVERYQLKSKVLFMNERTANKWINLVSPDWSGAIPATWITAAGGEKFHEGKLTYEELENMVKAFLK